MTIPTHHRLDSVACKAGVACVLRWITSNLLYQGLRATDTSLTHAVSGRSTCAGNLQAAIQRQPIYQHVFVRRPRNARIWRLRFPPNLLPILCRSREAVVSDRCQPSMTSCGDDAIRENVAACAQRSDPRSGSGEMRSDGLCGAGNARCWLKFSCSDPNPNCSEAERCIGWWHESSKFLFFISGDRYNPWALIEVMEA